MSNGYTEQLRHMAHECIVRLYEAKDEESLRLLGQHIQAAQEQINAAKPQKETTK